MNTSNTAPFRSMNMAKARVPLIIRDLETVDDLKAHHADDEAFRSSTTGVCWNDEKSESSASKTSPKSSQHSRQVGPSSSLTSFSFPWKVSMSSIPNAPQDVPLEPSAVQIRGTSLSDIASRVCAFMKRNSICCNYRGNEARVDCQTFCGLKFVVQLWRWVEEHYMKTHHLLIETARHAAITTDSTRSTTSSSGDAIILEVQRRRGCCIVMRSIRRKLYKTVLKDPVVFAKRTSCNRQRQWLHKMCRAPSATESSTSIDQPRCLSLLASQKQDCNRFGMEMLLMLVNTNHVGRERAEETAQALIFGTGLLGVNLRCAFLAVMNLSTLQQEVIIDGEEDVDDVSSLDCSSPSNSQERHLQLLCVQALSACLEIIMEKERDYLCNEANMLDLGSDFWSRTMSFLMAQLDECATRQHDAALAAKCFRILETLHPGLLIPVTDGTVIGSARKAYKFGQQHHHLLEKESEKLLKCMNLLITSPST